MQQRCNAVSISCIDKELDMHNGLRDRRLLTVPEQDVNCALPGRHDAESVMRKA
jgi:hypothetical protein